MFELLTKLVEILSSYGGRWLDGRHGTRDAKVAGSVLSVVLVLQEVIVRGARLLAVADDLLAGTGDDTAFAELLDAQVASLAEVRSELEAARGVLATLDVELYLDLVPFLDEKSGLLAQWGKQATRGRYATTTLFFLSEADLAHALEVSRSSSTASGMDLARTDFLLAVSDGLRKSRAVEVRDIRRPGGRDVQDVRAQIDRAAAELDRARALCRDLAERIEQGLGSEAVTELRRDLVSRKNKKK
ncbi:hypothetical protein [Streptosporangium saharense]|uniref:hypothetical protein n=1 Tax=Streptosporangium saharense TaxID=1706840 RepID=UPI003413439B